MSLKLSQLIIIELELSTMIERSPKLSCLLGIWPVACQGVLGLRNCFLQLLHVTLMVLDCFSFHSIIDSCNFQRCTMFTSHKFRFALLLLILKVIYYLLFAPLATLPVKFPHVCSIKGQKY